TSFRVWPPARGEDSDRGTEQEDDTAAHEDQGDKLTPPRCRRWGGLGRRRYRLQVLRFELALGAVDLAVVDAGRRGDCAGDHKEQCRQPKDEATHDALLSIQGICLTLSLYPAASCFANAKGMGEVDAPLGPRLVHWGGLGSPPRPGGPTCA